MRKTDYIKHLISEHGPLEKIAPVVECPEALIPYDEAEFDDLCKFGLYPAHLCQPFVTKQGTPFYNLDNMAVIPIRQEQDWMHYGDFRFRQIEILYIMARMDSKEAHEWLKNNLFQKRVDARKKMEYKSKFRDAQRPDWKTVQTEWMKYCLNLKYRDFAAFRKDLHATDKIPVEDATHTNYASNLFWGAALTEFEGRQYYFGCNVLGKLLSELRASRGHLAYTLPEDFHLFGRPILPI